jgi:hypothetical protein
MKKQHYFKIIRFPFIIILLSGCSTLFSQEAESNAVTFRLNNIPDHEPPTITILSPEIGEDGRFLTQEETIEVIGEVADRSRIRFVSINTDIRVVNETGIFAKTVKLIPGENRIQLKAMDEHNNLQDQYIIVQYTPPVVTLADRINGESKYYGLLIGIDNYGDPDIPDLSNPVRDAEKLRRTLTRNFTFDEENVKVLRDPRRSDIIDELDKLRRKVTQEDNLLIFYAGHGYWDADGSIGYWLPSDATRASTADWFPNSTLVDYIQAIHSKHTLLITDACFAGSIFKARSVSMDKEIVYETIYDSPSRKAMTSGALTEVPDESAFVKYLIQRLDENQETYLSSQELFSSFLNAVISNSRVLPQYGEIQNVGNEGGDFIFLKRE